MPNPIRRDLLKDWNVLVVDDEPDSLEVAARILKFYGAAVYTAANGREALDTLAAIQPRFIICDLSMPVMDGWELLFELQEKEASRGLPVVALTAHAMDGDPERGIAAGFHGYITKPLTASAFMPDLLALLRQIPAFATELAEEIV